MFDDLFDNDRECSEFDDKHDRGVCDLEQTLESSPLYGDVKTDHTGGEQPQSRGGFIPDAEAENRLTGETTFFEVDSSEPSARDEKQHEEFRQLSQSQDEVEYERLWVGDLL